VENGERFRGALNESQSALLPSRSEAWIWITKPNKSSIKEFISGRGALARTLSVEGPAKNQLGRTILFSGHLSQPMIVTFGTPTKESSPVAFAHSD
jgi:hypothetical protein